MLSCGRVARQSLRRHDADGPRPAEAPILEAPAQRQTPWIAVADAMPDDEETVLIVLAGGEVWTGFRRMALRVRGSG